MPTCGVHVCENLNKRGRVSVLVPQEVGNMKSFLQQLQQQPPSLRAVGGVVDGA